MHGDGVILAMKDACLKIAPNCLHFDGEKVTEEGNGVESYTIPMYKFFFPALTSTARRERPKSLFVGEGGGGRRKTWQKIFRSSVRPPARPSVCVRVCPALGLSPSSLLVSALLAAASVASAGDHDALDALSELRLSC